MDLKVEVEPFIGKSVISRDRVRFQQYRINVEYEDGTREVAGYIGTQPGAKAMLIRLYTPMEADIIKQKVGEIIGRGDVQGSVRPDVPIELLQKDEEGTADDDDFDS